jgi:RNA polymerase sigma factor (TIGR02999 family)
MADPGRGEVTVWLERWRQGDRGALDHLVPLLYDELREAARRQIRREISPHTLGATALVHEVYLRLLGQRRLEASDRNSFLAIAATTMRRVLVDYARRRRRLKRGGQSVVVSLEDAGEPVLLSEVEVDEVLGLSRALDRLAAEDERAATIVEYRFFAGLTLEETAALLQLSERTVHRTWTFARAWLRKEIAGLSDIPFESRDPE